MWPRVFPKIRGHIFFSGMFVREGRGLSGRTKQNAQQHNRQYGPARGLFASHKCNLKTMAWCSATRCSTEMAIVFPNLTSWNCVYVSGTQLAIVFPSCGTFVCMYVSGQCWCRGVHTRCVCMCTHTCMYTWVWLSACMGKNARGLFLQMCACIPMSVNCVKLLVCMYTFYAYSPILCFVLQYTPLYLFCDSIHFNSLCLGFRVIQYTPLFQQSSCCVPNIFLYTKSF